MEPDQGAADSTSGCGSTPPAVRAPPLLEIRSEDPQGHGPHLLSIFPEEIWLLILKNVKEEDLETVINASPFFRNLLLPLRTQFLFQKVWTLLATSKTYDKYVMHCGVSGLDVWEVHRYSGKFKRVPSGRDPLLFPEENEGQVTSSAISSPALWYSEILQLRLVCQSWRDGIDSFYQNHPRHLQIGQDPARNTIRTTCWTDFVQSLEHDILSNRWDGQSLQKFMEHFKITHGETTGGAIRRNPFISRKVSIIYEFGNRRRTIRHWNRMSQFLSTYGEHIWYLDVRLTTEPNVSTGDKLSKLRELLQPLKNLKVLKIICPFLRPSYAEPAEPVVLEEPLPTSEHLQFLSTSFMAPALSSHLLGSNGHVKTLEVQNHNINCNFEEVCTVPLPNLKELSLIVDSEISFKRLQESPMASWQLEKIWLDFRYAHGVEWADIFKMMGNKWADTLTEVQMRMTRAEETDDIRRKNKILEKCESLRLNLPRVKKFRVAMTSFCSLDFILPMKDSLEYLDVDVCFEHRCSKLACQVEQNQVIQFLGYTSRLLESNIWNIFPKLKQYRIFEKDLFVEPAWSFTRQDWKLSLMT